MLRQLARPLIRRGLHTTSNSSRQQSWRGAHLAFAASGAASALLAWQLHSNPIMLDADTTAHSSPKGMC
jgi:ferric-dicitrate binding protein FerR (iron transport regulator)